MQQRIRVNKMIVFFIRGVFCLQMYKNPWEYKKDVSTYERKHADIFLFFVQILKFFVQNFQKHADVFSDFRQYIGKDFTVAEEDISYA